MSLQDIFPLEFRGDFEDYRALMRSILIKALYDSRTKALSRYKGMHKSNYFNECWSLRFGFYNGIYGLVLKEVINGEAVFNLHYFPSFKDKLIEASSLFEAIVSSKDNYIEKVRNFGEHEELFSNFKIAEIYFKVERNGIYLSFRSSLKDKILSKDGVFFKGETIIKKGSIDKNFPSFRVCLAFINFLHIAISKIYDPDFDSLQVYKRQGYVKIYDKSGRISTKRDIFATEIYVNMLYGKNDNVYEFSEFGFIKLAKTAPILKFLFNLHEDKDRVNPINANDRSNFFIITGYLGSGKTKFLQNFIEYETAQNRFTGVIQNEIGKIGLDGSLLDAKFATVEIDEGCVCCSMAGQIKMAVAELSKKKPDTILLETTGVANPFNLLSELNEIKDLVNLCSVVTVVDGANILTEYKKSKILLEQIKAADIILLNKIDLISNDKKAKIREILVENNRCAEIFETINGELNPNFLFYNHSQTSYMASVLIEGKLHATHAKEGIVSFKKDICDKIDKSEFIRYIKTLPDNFYRIKGLICFENEDWQSVFQFVNGKFDISFFDKTKKCDNFLVFIGRNIDRNFYFPKKFSAYDWRLSTKL